MSDTPRVDEYIRAYNEKEKWARDMSPVELAEQLERENAALRIELKDARTKGLSVALEAYTRDLQDLKAENAALRRERVLTSVRSGKSTTISGKAMICPDCGMALLHEDRAKEGGAS